MDISHTLPTFNLIQNQYTLFYAWLLENSLAYIEPRILVVGKNVNSLADLLINRNTPFHLANTDADNMTELHAKYQVNAVVRSIKHINLKDEFFVDHYPSKIGVFSTVICTEILETKASLKLYLSNMSELLQPFGHALITLPSFNIPFTDAGISLDELKIFDRKFLSPLLSNFRILNLRHFSLTSSASSGLEYREINHVTAIARKAF